VNICSSELHFVGGTVTSPFCATFEFETRYLQRQTTEGKVLAMRKAALILATAATLAVTAVAAPHPPKRVVVSVPALLAD
jgi:hypothetical protein